MSIKREFKNLVIYGLGNITQSAIGFILLPIFMKIYTPAQYGVISVILLITTFISLFVSCGMMSGLHRQYFQVGTDKKKVLPGTLLLWYAAASVIIGVVTFFSSGFLSQMLFDTTQYSYSIQTLCLIIPLSLFIDVPYNIFRLEKKSVNYVTFSITRLLVDGILKYVFIVILQRGVDGYFESTVIGLVLINIIIFISTKKYITIKLDREQLRIILKLGMPFIVSGFAVWSFNSVDRMFINKMADQTAVGLYSTASKFSQMFNIIVYKPLSLLLPPIIFSYIAKHNDEKISAMFKKLFHTLLVVGGAAVIAISIGSVDLAKIMVKYFGSKPEYLQSLYIIPFLTFANFFYFLTMPASYSMLKMGTTGKISKISVISAIVNLGLNFVLVSLFNELGAAIATVLTYAFYCAGVYYLADRQFRVNYNVRSVVLTLCIIVLIIFLYTFVQINNPILSLFIRSISGVSIFIIFFWFFSGILSSENKKNLLDILYKHLKRYIRV